MEKVQTKIIVCITIAVIVLLVLYQQRTTDEKFISVDNVDIHDYIIIIQNIKILV